MNKLKQIRLSKGYSLRKLELKSGVSRQTVANIEKGRGVPTELTLYRLAKALGCEVEEIWMK